MKELSQDLGLNLIPLYWIFKPKSWLSTFVNTDPDELKDLFFPSDCNLVAFVMMYLYAGPNFTG